MLSLPPPTFVMPGLDPGIHAAYRDAMSYWVYILTSAERGTLYVGMTNDLVRRDREHREAKDKSFTSKYGASKLVYFEQHDDPANAIQREKNLKHWSRAWKLQLIERANPNWHDLYDGIAS